MTDTATPPSAALRQTAPHHPDWNHHTTERRDHLLARMDTLAQQADGYDATCDQLADDAAQADALYDAIPDVGDDPTELEWLTRRTAQTSHQIAVLHNDIARREAALQQARLTCEISELEVRVAHLDDLTEGGSYAAGNDKLLEVMALDVRLAALDFGHEVAALELARRQLTLLEGIRRELAAALRAIKHPTGQGHRP